MTPDKSFDKEKGAADLRKFNSEMANAEIFVDGEWVRTNDPRLYLKPIQHPDGFRYLEYRLKK